MTAYNLTPADLPGLDADLVQRREKFVTAYCMQRGWPTDPARLTSTQLFAILNDKEWPR